MSILCSMVGASFVTAAAEVIRRKNGIGAVAVTVSTTQSKFGGASMGNSIGYLQVADNSQFSFGTGDFTIEFQFRPSGLDSIDILWDQRPNGSQGLQPTIYTQGAQLFYYTNQGNRITGGNLSLNTWHHIAVSRSGTSTRMFINGTQTGSTFTDSTNYVSSAAGIRIGSDQFTPNANYAPGYYDEIRISNTARYTANFTAPTSPFVNDANTLLLIHADGTDGSTYFEDDNGVRSKKGITAVGNAQIDTAQSKFGGASALFDGTGDYLYSPATLSLGTGNFTIESWVRVGSVQASVILDNRTSEIPGVFGLQSDSTVFYYDPTVGLIKTTGTYTTNTWFHVCWERNGNTFKMYINGVASYTNNSFSGDFGTNRNIRIGISYADGSGFNGYMDEFRISNTARYTANFTPSTTPFVNDDNTLLLIHADGTDASTYFDDDNGVRFSNSIQSLNGAQITTAQSKFGGSSILFDGTNDALVVGQNPNFIMSGNWTIEFWIRWNVAEKEHYIINNRVGGAYTTGSFQIGRSLSTNPVVFSSPQTGNLTIISSPSNGVWYHVAIVKSDTTVKTYLDGTNVSTGTHTSSLFETHQQLGIGGYGLGTSDYFNGWMDELRISKTARYTANFTPSTTPFVNDSNTVLLIHGDGTNGSTVFNDDNGVRSQQGVVAFGNAQVDTAQSKFGGASALFDGTGDYLTVQNINSIGTGDFTFECWFRPTSSGLLNRGIFHFSPSGLRADYTNDLVIGTINSTRWVLYRQGNYIFIDTSTISADTWHHVALVRYSGVTKFYWNGTEYNSVTDTLSYTGTVLAIGGYYSTSNLLIGHIDEFRISNSARYTANFTAPTTPFQNDANTLLLIHADGTDGSTVFVDDNGKNKT